MHHPLSHQFGESCEECLGASPTTTTTTTTTTQDHLPLIGLGVASYILWNNKMMIALLGLGYLMYRNQKP